MPWNQLSGGTVTAMRRNGRSGMVDINGALRADILRWNASTRRKTLTRAPQLMELVTREHGNVLILELLDARLDAYEAPALKSSLNRIIDDGHLHIVVNVQHVSFIDSAGLAALISGLKQLSGRGQLRICAAQPAVRTVLQLTRLDRVIPHFDSEDAALENFPS